MLYSCLTPLTSIFRFLPKHFDPWLFIYWPNNLLSKGPFCMEIFCALKSHILDFYLSILTLSSLSSPTFFSCFIYLFWSLSIFSKMSPTSGFRTRWNNSCTDVIEKRNVTYCSWCSFVYLANALVQSSIIQTFCIQLVVYYYLSAIPLQWNGMPVFIHWWTSLLCFWNIHLLTAETQWNAG